MNDAELSWTTFTMGGAGRRGPWRVEYIYPGGAVEYIYPGGAVKFCRT